MPAVAIVSGAASGLGLATATRFAAEGWAVVGIDLNAERGQEAFAALGPGARFVRGSVTSEDDVGAAVEVAKGLGELRASVACAGVPDAARVVGRDGKAHDLAVFRKVVEVNLIGTFNLHRLAAAAMASNAPDAQGQRGVLIGTASVAAFEGQIGQVAYSASKGGVHAMTLPIARDLANLGIRCLTIAPGLFDTPMMAGLRDDIRAALAATVPQPSRLGDPAEYAALAWTIVQSPYLNGETIRLDGAIRLAPR